MRIGIISNSDTFIPLAHTMASQGMQVQLFYSPASDSLAHQKVMQFVQSPNITCTVDDGSNLYTWFETSQPAICFVLNYGSKIDVARIPAQLQQRTFNIHFGPLPAYRGPVPLFWQLKNGEPTVGLAIHHLTDKMDAGPVVWMKDISNESHLNYALLNLMFSHICIEGVMHIFQCLLGNRGPLQTIDRSNVQNRYYKRPQAPDITINWPIMTAKEICDLLRACNPWNKGAQTLYKGMPLKLLDAEEINLPEGNIAAPGTIISTSNCLHIACAGNTAINITMLNLNDSFVPARFAKQYELVEGGRFG